jgi:hypothetical protein
VPHLGIEYDFEEAMSLADLQKKIVERVVQGWTVSGEPRRVAVKLRGNVKETRFLQAFYRTVRTPLASEPR